MCTREELTMIIGIFQLAKNKLNENGDLAQIKLEFAQYMIFTRIGWKKFLKRLKNEN